MPPSLGGTRWWVSTVKPSAVSPSTVRSSSSRFWNTPPDRATVPSPCASRVSAQTRTINVARNQGQEITPRQFAEEESVILSPIPCWAHLPPEVYSERIAGLVEEIESEAAHARSRKGISVLGVDAILEQDPQHRPESLACSPAPLVHAATQASRKAFYDAYAWFVSAFRQAAEKLRQGDRNAVFPAGSFPPALPFVAG